MKGDVGDGGGGAVVVVVVVVVLVVVVMVVTCTRKNRGLTAALVVGGDGARAAVPFIRMVILVEAPVRSQRSYS